jgi:Predicted membrane protein
MSENNSGNWNRSWAILFARLVLGLIFFMAGFWKVFQLGPLEHARKYFLPFSNTFLPTWSLWATGVTIPFIELIAGALVIIGLRTRDALVALGFVLAIVTFGHLLKEPLYEFHTHVIPRLALLLFILVLPREEDKFSIDHLLQKRLRKSQPKYLSDEPGRHKATVKEKKPHV